jgi:hypothetical protein
VPLISGTPPYASLSSGPYIIVVTSVDVVGELLGHVIYRIGKAELIRVAASIDSLSPEDRKIEGNYLTALQDMLSTLPLYFSYTLDLTHRMQAIHKLPSNAPLWKRVTYVPPSRSLQRRKRGSFGTTF